MTRLVRRPKGTDIALIRHEESAKAYAVLQKQGLDLPDKPDEDRIPNLTEVEDLTDLDDKDLMDLFRRLTSWAGFLAGQVSCAQIDERASEKALDYAMATAMVSNWKGGSADRVAIAKASMSTDPEVQRLRDEVDERHAYRKLVEVLHNNVERDQAVVSREITRRTNAEPRNRRSERSGA